MNKEGFNKKHASGPNGSQRVPWLRGSLLSDFLSLAVYAHDNMKNCLTKAPIVVGYTSIEQRIIEKQGEGSSVTNCLVNECYSNGMLCTYELPTHKMPSTQPMNEMTIV